MNLNPKKCPFRVRSSKFLGYMIDQRGIEVNPDNIQAIVQMQSLTTVKELQRLIGCIAALGRFMSKSVDKCFPSSRCQKRKHHLGAIMNLRNPFRSSTNTCRSSLRW